QPWEWGRDYVYRDGLLLAAVEPDGGGEATSHFHLDHLGSPRQITDDGAVETAFHTYYPFGDEATDPDQDEGQLRFTGHERDENGSVGAGALDYMHARYCSPATGRFLSVDPANSAKGTDPQTWNRYVYGQNNPLKFFDPNGLTSDVVWKIQAMNPVPAAEIAAMSQLATDMQIEAGLAVVGAGPRLLGRVGSGLSRLGRWLRLRRPSSMARLADSRARLTRTMHAIELGTDPHKGFVASEARIGMQLEGVVGRLRRDPSADFDWILSGSRKTFDAVGPAPREFFNLDSFTTAIRDHLRKNGLDEVVVGLEGLTGNQKRGVVFYLDTLSEVDRKKIRVLE
ncbi:MAG: RHS repeat-associated core domain-containing protein, partial [bacterium]|nr:RHS repeat-associated core domain-containing protein [bacterium]